MTPIPGELQGTQNRDNGANIDAYVKRYVYFDRTYAMKYVKLPKFSLQAVQSLVLNDIRMARRSPSVEGLREQGLSAPKKSWSRFFNESIAHDAGIELELLLLALSTGVLDATTFPDYRVFISNQTGNTVFIAVGAFKIADDIVDLKNVGVSLGCFLLGGFSFGQLADRCGRTRRSWLLFTNLFQTILVFIATALRHFIAKDSFGSEARAVITLLAFSAGAQVAMARTVQVPEVPTAVVTSAYIDVVVDPNLFGVHNEPRNLRVAFLLCMLVGAFIGAAAYAHLGAAFSMLLSAIMKSFVIIALLFNKANE
ncbi:MAG: hypothetical protein M1814_000305 [Vezdaea aestivalis]|nr:MAG: hypothetical protein M1814_000305 [Vezdaea aestivalis]